MSNFCYCNYIQKSRIKLTVTKNRQTHWGLSFSSSIKKTVFMLPSRLLFSRLHEAQSPHLKLIRQVVSKFESKRGRRRRGGIYHLFFTACGFCLFFFGTLDRQTGNNIIAEMWHVIIAI